MTSNAKWAFAIFFAILGIVFMGGLVAQQHEAALAAAPLIAAPTEPNYLEDTAALDTSVTESMSTKIADSSSDAYMPGVKVDSVHCIKDVERQFSCLAELSNGTSLSPVVVVSEDGHDWVSHAR